MEIICTENIYKVYNRGRNEVKALDGVSLSVLQGEFLAVMGRSGSGKSTLLNILGCLDVPTGGRYFLFGKSSDSFGEKELDALKHPALVSVLVNATVSWCSVSVNREVLKRLLNQVQDVEQEIATLLHRSDLQTRLHGKDLLQSAGEYSTEAILRGLPRGGS